MMRILYVEDSCEFRHSVIERHLGDHEVTVADNGPEGLRRWTEGGYDLVLLDYELGGRDCNGPEVLEVIRSSDAEIPVIAVSMDDGLNRRLVDEGATIGVPKRRISELPGWIQTLTD